MEYRNHTFLAAWGKFGVTLEDVSAFTVLPMFRDTQAMGIVFDGEDKEKLKFSNNDYLGSTMSAKGIYLFVDPCFKTGEQSLLCRCKACLLAILVCITR